MLAVAAKAFAPGTHPLPGDARRHGAQLPRGAALPRPAGGGVGRGTRRRVGAGEHRRGPRGRGDRAAGVAQPAADRDPAGRDPGASLRRGVRRRAPRRGEGAGEGARLLAARRLRPVGSQEPAARGLDALQRPAPPAASTCASSRCRTGPSSTSGSTSTRRGWNCRRSTSRTSARSSVATGCCTRWGRTSRCCRTRRRSGRGVRYRTVGDMTCTAAVRSDATTLTAVVGEIAATRITERGETRADDRISETGMEDRKREGYF